MGKKYSQLSLDERYTLAFMQKQGHSIRKIATTLDRSPSTLARELKRNVLSKINGYKPLFADEIAWSRRWRGSKLERHSELQKYVLEKLVMGLSPEQIAGRMSLENHTIKISHESIYRFIYKQIAKYKDYSWRHYLPHAKHKRGHRLSHNLSPVSHFKDRISIHQRPENVKNRDDFGHWECDLMMFSDKKQNLMVTQERKSRYTILNLQSTKESTPLIKNLHKNFKKIPKEHIKTITFDNGTEFAHHYKLKETIDIETYFCDPYSPWQKGGVENMNRRLRRYLPRKSNLDTLNPQDILWLQHKMNNTPRKCLGFRTPLEVLSNVSHFKCESTLLPTQE